MRQKTVGTLGHKVKVEKIFSTIARITAGVAHINKGNALVTRSQLRTFGQACIQIADELEKK